jgi:molybdate transport system permease protein
MAFDLSAIRLSAELALITASALLVLATPLAWWLTHSKSRWTRIVEAVVALPLVLPPTVLGFYLLILMGPQGWLGSPWLRMTGHTLTFSFAGLVVASTLYSLPFAVQPIQGAFEAVERAVLEAAWMDGAGSITAFRSIVLPLASRGFLTAAVLTFAHTLGEFGVVLMMGGNIPGETRVISIAIFEQVETLNYAAAHQMSAGLLIFSFAVLVIVYGWNSGLRRIRVS